MQYYSVVDSSGFITASMITNNPDYTVSPGYRLLPDSPPNPGPDGYQPGKTKAVRVEPVPEDATEVPYRIEDELVTAQPSNDIDQFIQELISGPSAQ